MWLMKPWNVGFDSNYEPRITVIISTHNEAELIEGKLENVFSQDYSPELLEILIVDSSTDGIAEKALGWAKARGFEVKVLREPFRRSKTRALKTAQDDIIVLMQARYESLKFQQ